MKLNEEILCDSLAHCLPTVSTAVNACYEDGLHCHGRNTLGSILNRLIKSSYMKEQGVFKCIGNSYLH